MSQETQEVTVGAPAGHAGITLNEAVQRAKDWLVATMASENISNLGLEEVEHGDGLWHITLGFSRPWDDVRNAVTVLTGTVMMHRTQKVIVIDERTGDVLSMRNKSV